MDKQSLYVRESQYIHLSRPSYFFMCVHMLEGETPVPLMSTTNCNPKPNMQEWTRGAPQSL